MPQSHTFTLGHFLLLPHHFILPPFCFLSLPCDWTQCVDRLWYWLCGWQARWCDIWRGGKQISVSLLNALPPSPAADEGRTDWRQRGNLFIYFSKGGYLSQRASLSSRSQGNPINGKKIIIHVWKWEKLPKVFSHMQRFVLPLFNSFNKKGEGLFIHMWEQ